MDARRLLSPARLPLAVVASFALYSITLLVIEWRTSQDYARNFVTDITGPVPFYAVNTTLCVCLLSGTALCFLIAANLTKPSRHSVAYWWRLSQVAVFVYLTCDERFQLHEKIGGWLDHGDHYILLAVGGGELCLLWLGWRNRLLPTQSFAPLVVAGVLFAIMVAIDALGAHDGRLRLTLEDVTKTWACLFFFRFGWVVLFDAIANQEAQTA